MQAITRPGLFAREGCFEAQCVCGKRSVFAAKNSAIRMIDRGVCRYCRPDYRRVDDDSYQIYQRIDGKWCSLCSGCNQEQSYTRKDHAKQSSLQDWQCRKCVAAARRFNENKSVGDHQRTYNKFRTSAKNRGLSWELTIEDLFRDYDETCAMTGWPISIAYGNQTASLDRIDNAVGYVLGNIQWVHVMVNMTRNKYSVQDFISMCTAVSNKAKCS